MATYWRQELFNSTFADTACSSYIYYCWYKHCY